MAVVINDFEVIEDSSASNTSQQGQNGGQQPSGGQATLKPEDIERIVRHFEERKARLNAD